MTAAAMGLDIQITETANAVPVGGNMWALDRLKVISPDHPTFALNATIELDNGVYAMTRIDARRHDSGDPITSETLRLIPVKAIVESVGATVGAIIRTDRDHHVIQRRPSKGWPLVVDGAPADAVIKHSSDSVLGWAANLYTFATMCGLGPSKMIQEVLDAAPSTAGYWIRRAKDRGMIDIPDTDSVSDGERADMVRRLAKALGGG